MTIFRVVNTILPKRYHRSLLKFELGVIEQFQRPHVQIKVAHMTRNLGHIKKKVSQHCRSRT